jgi:hypothetical protein
MKIVDKIGSIATVVTYPFNLHDPNTYWITKTIKEREAIKSPADIWSTCEDEARFAHEIMCDEVIDQNY